MNNDNNDSLQSLDDAVKDYDEVKKRIEEKKIEPKKEVKKEEPKKVVVDNKPISLVEMMKQQEEAKKQRITKNENDYLKYFIGENYDVFESGGISWAYLFMGEYYLLFRKMYIPAIIKCSLSVILAVLAIFIYNINSNVTVVFILLFLLLQILPIFVVKRYYYDYAKRKIKKILKDNKGKSEQEIIKICNRMGGTDIILPIILLICLTLISAFVNNKNSLQTYEVSMKKLHTLSTNYLKLKSGDYDSQNIIKDNECSVSIDIHRSSSQTVIIDGDYERMNINNKEWFYRTNGIIESYIYIDYDYIYKVEAQVIDNNVRCKKSIDILVDNLDIK